MKATWVIICDRGSFCILTDAAHEVTNVVVAKDCETADAIKTSLGELGYAGQPILLAISAWDCVAAILEQVDSRTARNRKALSYLLERLLPITSEESVADYCQKKGSVLAVAVRTGEFKPLLDELTERDVYVTSVCPESMLLAEGMCGDEEIPKNTLLLIQHVEYLELILLKDRLPVAWRICDSPTIDLEVASLGLAEDVALRSLGTGYHTADNEFVGLERNDTNPHTVVLDVARSVLTAKSEPWFELRRDALAGKDRFVSIRRQLRLAAAGGLILLASLGTFFCMRISYYEQQLNEFETAQRSVFSEVFPASRIPLAIRPRLEIELKSRQGTSGSARIPVIESALTLLHESLDCLPHDLRFRLLQIRVEETSIDLDGQALNHSDSEQIAARLREQGLAIDPPRSESLSTGGVSFSIHGARKEQ